MAKVVVSGDVEVLALHVFFPLLFEEYVGYNPLRDLGGLNLRGLRQSRDPAPALALSYSFGLGAPQIYAPYVSPVLCLVVTKKKKVHCRVMLGGPVRPLMRRMVAPRKACDALIETLGDDEVGQDAAAASWELQGGHNCSTFDEGEEDELCGGDAPAD